MARFLDLLLILNNNTGECVNQILWNYCRLTSLSIVLVKQNHASQKCRSFLGLFWNLWNFGMLHIYKTSIQSFQFICIYISDACNPIVVDLQHCLAYFHHLIWWGLSHWVKWMDWFLYDGDLRHERVKNLYITYNS